MNKTMGSRSSKVMSVWADTEGGVRGVSTWDVSFVMDLSDAVVGHRFCDYASANARAKQLLRKSVPTTYHSIMRKSGTVHLEYTVDETSVQLVSCTPIDSMRAGVQELVSHWDAGTPVFAWGMTSHDKPILEDIMGKDHGMDFRDPLKAFRSRFGMPKNTLSSCARGTPRYRFSREFDGVGPSHTSLVDALHLRDVTLHSTYVHDKFGALPTDKKVCLCEGVDRETLIDHVLKSDDYTVVLPEVAGKNIWENASEEVRKPPTLEWVEDEEWWETPPRQLKSAHSAEYKRRIADTFKQFLGKQVLPPNLQNRLNSVKREDTLTEIVASVMRGEYGKVN